MRRPLVDLGLVLAQRLDREGPQLGAELLLRVELVRDPGAPGAVGELAEGVPLQQQQAAGAQGAVDAGEHLPPLVRRRELDEDGDDGVVRLVGPAPVLHADDLVRHGHTPLGGQALRLGDADRRAVEGVHREALLREPGAVAPLPVGDAQHPSAGRDEIAAGDQERVRCGAEQEVVAGEARIPVGRRRSVVAHRAADGSRTGRRGTARRAPSLSAPGAGLRSPSRRASPTGAAPPGRCRRPGPRRGRG